MLHKLLKALNLAASGLWILSKRVCKTLRSFVLFIYSHKLLFLSVIAVLIAIILIFCFRITSHKDPGDSLPVETRKLIELVSRHMILPDNEQPLTMTVSNPQMFQQTFNSIKTGDEVLIYTKAGKMIFYDPDGDRIIDIQPLSVGGQ